MTKGRTMTPDPWLIAVRGARRFNVRERAIFRPIALNILTLTACLLVFRPVVSAETPGPSEYQVKAAILFNLTKYVEWPPSKLAGTTNPIVLGILGQDNFGDDFKRMVEGKAVNGHKLVFQHMAWNEDVRNAHILFVSASEKRRLPELLEKLKDASVLTVGECDGFIPLGGIINLGMKDNRIRPEVNLAAAERSHLKISSKLLSICDVVGKAGERRIP